LPEPFSSVDPPLVLVGVVVDPLDVVVVRAGVGGVVVVVVVRMGVVPVCVADVVVPVVVVATGALVLSRPTGSLRLVA
jgi:hypothetical protein